MICLDPMMNHGFVLNAKRTRKSWKSCHMFSDTNSRGELFDMAEAIGLKKDWLQKSRLGIWHFDLIQSRRAAAIKNGAVELTRKEASEIWKKIKTT